MDTNLQPASSARPLAPTIGIVEESPNLAGQLGPFHPRSEHFASFRNIEPQVAAQPHLHNTAQTQDAVGLEGSTHNNSNDRIALLRPTGPSFQQPSYEGLVQGPIAGSFAGQLQGMKLIPDPPNLEYWRDRLFHVDEMITLSEDEYVGIRELQFGRGLTDSKRISHMWTMFILIAQLNDINAGHLCLITGIVGSKDVLQEPQSLMTRTRRSANVQPGNEIFVMLKSKLQNTYPLPQSLIEQAGLKVCLQTLCQEDIHYFPFKGTSLSAS